MLEYLPPRTQHEVTIDGYACPQIEARETPDGKHCLITLDGRFGATILADEAEQVLWLLANALAIGEGFSCHGENAQPMNRHKTQVGEISTISTVQ